MMNNVLTDSQLAKLLSDIDLPEDQISEEKQSPIDDVSKGDWVDVQCVWHLRPAEHCKTCVGRNNHVELIRVHKTVPIPSVIG